MTRITDGRLNSIICAAVLLGTPLPSVGAGADQIWVTKASGGSIQTKLSDSIILNDKSSLKREWIAINHAALPVKLDGTPGVSVIYVDGDRYSSGGYKYKANFTINVTEPVYAVEIRFITFDIWGQRGKSLVFNETQDFHTGPTKLSATWNLFGENEAAEYYASIAYVSRVRTKDGKVISADVRPVIEEAKKFYAKFSEGDLDPEKPSKSGK